MFKDWLPLRNLRKCSYRKSPQAFEHLMYFLLIRSPWAFVALSRKAPWQGPNAAQLASHTEALCGSCSAALRGALLSFWRRAVPTLIALPKYNQKPVWERSPRCTNKHTFEILPISQSTQIRNSTERSTGSIKQHVWSFIDNMKWSSI